MHRFLTAFLCLSTLAMTQNVVAGTPNPAGLLQTAAMVGDPVGGEVPSPSTMLLLVTGLAGLSAVGSRGARSPRPIADR